MSSTQSELLARIHNLCFNDDRDAISREMWDSCSVPQLRTVVAMLENGGLEMISEYTPRPSGGRGHCFFIEQLVEWVRRHGRHPVTGREMTGIQRRHVYDAYRRITGQVPNGLPADHHFFVENRDRFQYIDAFSNANATGTQVRVDGRSIRLSPDFGDHLFSTLRQVLAFQLSRPSFRNLGAVHGPQHVIRTRLVEHGRRGRLYLRIVPGAIATRVTQQAQSRTLPADAGERIFRILEDEIRLRSGRPFDARR